MDNNTDTNEELKQKNQDVLRNANQAGIDISMESLIDFFSKYSNNLSNDINRQICLIKNVNPDSEESMISLNIINGFFTLLSDKLKELITNKIDKLKIKIDNLTDDEYNKELRYMSIIVNNQLLEFYSQNIDVLVNELASDVDDITKDKINNYLFEIIYGKMMNVLRDKFIVYITIIGNKFKENKLKIEEINEKTIK